MASSTNSRNSDRRDGSDTADTPAQGKAAEETNLSSYTLDLIGLVVIVGLLLLLPNIVKAIFLSLAIYGCKRRLGLYPVAMESRCLLYFAMYLVFELATSVNRETTPSGASFPEIWLFDTLLFYPIPTISFVYDAWRKRQLSVVDYIFRSAVELVVLLPIWACFWAYAIIASGMIPMH